MCYFIVFSDTYLCPYIPADFCYFSSLIFLVSIFLYLPASTFLFITRTQTYLILLFTILFLSSSHYCPPLCTKLAGYFPQADSLSLYHYFVIATYPLITLFCRHNLQSAIISSFPLRIHRPIRHIYGFPSLFTQSGAPSLFALGSPDTATPYK